MGWQEFLVFADASEDGVARLRMAMELTKSFNGKLEALVSGACAHLVCGGVGDH